MITRGCIVGCLIELAAAAVCGAVILAVWTLAPFLVDIARRVVP